MTARTRVTAVLAAIGTALVIGIPTVVVPNPWFGREIGVRVVDVIVLVALSLLTGALGSHVHRRRQLGRRRAACWHAALAIRVRAIRCGACALPARALDDQARSPRPTPTGARATEQRSRA